MFAYFAATRGGSKAAATSKMKRFVIIVNGFHKAFHLGCCSSPRSASGYSGLMKRVNQSSRNDMNLEFSMLFIKIKTAITDVIKSVISFIFQTNFN